VIYLVVRRVAGLLTVSLAIAGLLAMLLFAIGTIADGLLRWAINLPIDVVRDIGNLVAAGAMACCVPHMLLTRSSITIRFISAFIGGRPSQWADTFAAACVAIVLGGMVWQFYRFAGSTARAHETSPLLAIPVAPFWYFVDAILAIALAVQILVICEQASALLRGTSTAARTPYYE
jgi:TRAP-type transport system small permease protein